MNEEVLELEHAKTFMDVVLGVIIAFPLRHVACLTCGSHDLI
jgi:hypothetical protein